MLFLSSFRLHGRTRVSDGDAFSQEMRYTTGGYKELPPVDSEEVFVFEELRNLRHEERSSAVNLCLLITRENHLIRKVKRYVWDPKSI